MDHLYAPWRSDYIKGNKFSKKDLTNNCVFCYISQNAASDLDHQVLYRNDHFFIVMNKYPYTIGHMLLVPHLHTDKLELLPSHIWLAMNDKVYNCIAMLKSVFKGCDINLGMNLGAKAGAGIKDHIHYHVLPRFSYDSNFITSVSDARVYSSDFKQVFDQLLALKDEFL